jgi:predicted Zn-dependent protease
MRTRDWTSRCLSAAVFFLALAGPTCAEDKAEPTLLQKIISEVIMQMAKQIGITTWDVAKATWCESADFRYAGVQQAVRITHRDPGMIERVGNRAAGCAQARASSETVRPNTTPPAPSTTSRQPSTNSVPAYPQLPSQEQSRSSQNPPQDFIYLVAAMLRAVDREETEQAEQLLAELDARPKLIRPIDRSQAQAFNRRGREMLGVADLPHAVEFFAAAVNADPGYEEASTNLGYALIQQKRYSDALPPLLDSVGTTPRAANAYLLLGEALGEQPKPWAEGSTGAFMLAYAFSHSPGVALQSILKKANDGQLHDITRASAREAAQNIVAGPVPLAGK